MWFIEFQNLENKILNVELRELRTSLPPRPTLSDSEPMYYTYKSVEPICHRTVGTL